MFCFCTFSKINFVRSPISWRINSTSILAQSENSRRSFNQSLLFERKNYSSMYNIKEDLKELHCIEEIKEPEYNAQQIKL